MIADETRSRHARQLGLKPDAVTVEETEHGDVVTDGTGNRVLFDADGKLWWYGKAANDGLPLFAPPSAEVESAVEVPGDAESDGDELDEPTELDEVDDTDADQVPDGTANDVLGWVDGDPAKAARALEVEQGRDAPRSTLVAALTRIAGS